MKTLNKKETETQNTLARLRADNPPSLPATGVTATEKKLVQRKADNASRLV
ncbi:hypothetical protein [Klebsiella quasipneumoniae]|uniref:hypothetical protein n=1 Tax=Klebsiella quasipneumoniae TaxID=1463165 RepID=UPI002B05EBC1|nr:hypothetical protein [Klebsiella quasipneumoniae]